MRYATFVVLIAAGLVCRVSAQDAGSADGPRFEVASVKANPSAISGGYYRPAPDGFTTTGSVIEMMRLAFQLQSYRVVGGPEWASTQRYDVKARIAGPRTPGDFRIMLRHLLEDRFALRAHREQRPVPVYVLEMAAPDRRPGPALTAATRDCYARTARLEDRCTSSEGLGTYRAVALPWSATGAFISFLERSTNRPVLDRTGLSGQFSIDLEWKIETARGPDGAPIAMPAGMEFRPELFTALREQLGLKLDPRTEPIDVVVIDRVERPTPD